MKNPRDMSQSELDAALAMALATLGRVLAGQTPSTFDVGMAGAVVAEAKARLERMQCSRCEGEGFQSEDPGRPCVKCGGTGMGGR